MLIISDNSALSALAEMGMAWVLPKVAGRVTIPVAVAREGLRVTGLLAILIEAAIADEVDFDDALARLLATGFRLSHSLQAEARTRVAAIKQPGPET